LKVEKSLWYLNEGLIYLNHGSFGATPKYVLQRFLQLCEQVDKNPMKFYLEDYPALLESSRNKIADFLKAEPKKIVFVDNATTGVNSVLRSLQPMMDRNWEILTANHYYPAVKNTLSYISSITGCKVVSVELPDFVESAEQLKNLIINGINEKTKLVVIDLISSISGMIYPVEDIIKQCREKGILTLIDGAHAPGSIDLNLEELKPDWYTGNLHKWLFAPKGTAVLYVREPDKYDIHPSVISNNFGKGFTEEFDWVGTKNFCSWLSVPEALDFYHEHFDYNYCRHLSLFGRKLLISELNLTPMVDESLTGLMQSFWLPEKAGSTIEDVLALRKKLLNEYNFEVFLNPFKERIVMRISAQIYNMEEQYEKLVSSLKKEF